MRWKLVLRFSGEVMDKLEFKKLLDKEKHLYLGDNKKSLKAKKRSRNRRYVIWKYLLYFRNCQWWKQIREHGETVPARKLAKHLYHYYDKKRNLYSERSGVEIGINCRIGSCVDIWHGGVVINADLGSNCIIHGNSILGNKGFDGSGTPTIGNGVDIGAGAVIIGDVSIADGCKIGANALVCKSCSKENAVLVGIPTKPLQDI